jgi:hypothetical protein
MFNVQLSFEVALRAIFFRRGIFDKQSREAPPQMTTER